MPQAAQPFVFALLLSSRYVGSKNSRIVIEGLSESVGGLGCVLLSAQGLREGESGKWIICEAECEELS